MYLLKPTEVGKEKGDVRKRNKVDKNIKRPLHNQDSGRTQG